jgi:hypothetical protein
MREYVWQMLLCRRKNVRMRINATLLQPQHRHLYTRHYCRARGYNTIPNPTNSGIAEFSTLLQD